jgi:hypothetical protein
MAAFGLGQERNAWTEALESAKQKLETEKNPERRQALEGDVRNYTQLLAQTDQATVPSEKSVLYNYEVVPLDKSWDEPDNAMSQLLTRYKQELHDREISSEGEGEE